MGRAMAAMAALFRTMERELIGERTRVGMPPKRRASTSDRRTPLPAGVLDRIHREWDAGPTRKSLPRFADGLMSDNPTATGKTT